MEFGPLFTQTVENNLTNGTRAFVPGVKSADTKIGDFGIHIGGARKEKAVSRPTTALSKKAESTPFWLPKQYAIVTCGNVSHRYNASPFKPESRVGEGDYCIIFRKKGYFDRVMQWGYPTHADAVQALPALFVDKVVGIGEKDGTFYLYKMIKATKKALIIKTGFASREEAVKYRTENALEVLEFKFEAPELPHLSHIERRGTDYRHGRDITPKELCDTFGFPGIEFGNWLPQKERQEVLNQTFDAFMDLAHVTGLPLRAMSFNGLLAAAFGSRGVANALAHFEPDRFVFNLSRLKDAGSLAHEWFHALDNYIGATSAGIDLQRNAAGIINANRKELFATTSGIQTGIAGAFDQLKTIMRLKVAEVNPLENGEVESLQKAVTRSLNTFDYHAGRILNELKADPSPWASRNQKVATPEQLERAEFLVKEIREGRQGAACYHPTRALYKHAWYYRSFERVEELAAIVKSVTRRDYFGEHGMFSEWVNGICHMQETEAKIAELSAMGTVTREVPTEFLGNAREIDRYRSTPYWATTIELAARAFGAFVQDSIEKDGHCSQYLVHSHHNNPGSECKPYPEGAEREAINAQFRVLLDKVKAAF